MKHRRFIDRTRRVFAVISPFHSLLFAGKRSRLRPSSYACTFDEKTLRSALDFDTNFDVVVIYYTLIVSRRY